MVDTWSLIAVDADTIKVVVTIGESQHPWQIGTELVADAPNTDAALALIGQECAAYAETLRTASTPPSVLANAVGYVGEV